MGEIQSSSFFFFKQRTAYEMLRSLVGSEMCIRDRPWRVCVAARPSKPWPASYPKTATRPRVARSACVLSLIHI